MRSVFVGIGAFLARIDSETRCAVWTEEPTDHGFDPARLITIDLSRSPRRAVAGEISWDAVEIDDCYTGAGGVVRGTTLGPRWPEMELVGAIYLEESFLLRLPAAVRPPIPQRGLHGRPYEHKSVLYWPHVDDPRAAMRYA